MRLKLEDKQSIVSKMHAIVKSAQVAVLAEYRGLTVAEMTQLRAEARNCGVYLQVIRNTLAYRAFEGTPFSCLQPVLSGPLLLAVSQQELGSAPRLIRGFAKEHERLLVKELAFEGQLLSAKYLDKLVDLPTRSEALSRLMAAIQAPISRLVRVLAEPQVKLVRLLAAFRDQQIQTD